MEAVLPLDQMNVAEKLRAMETLWADLTRQADSLASPAWHADILRERDQALARGEEKPVDWELAKRQLRERLL